MMILGCDFSFPPNDAHMHICFFWRESALLFTTKCDMLNSSLACKPDDSSHAPIHDNPPVTVLICDRLLSLALFCTTLWQQLQLLNDLS